MPRNETSPSYSTTLKRFAVAGAAAASVAAMFALASPAQSHENHASITVNGDQRCIVSNGLPDNETGQFPNSGNPNTISEQNVNLCVAATPHKGSQPVQVRGSIGVGINGVQIRPGTADYYDPSSPRGFSRDRSSGWNLEGLGARDLLGMDTNNAHVDERGLYHYHGVADALAESAGSSLIGYAADGFEIHYVGNQQTSSYSLKSESRPSAPGGAHDGTYVQDWEYIAGSGSLDACNGGTMNGDFVYFATDSYPFFPRCLWGNVSSDFTELRGQPGPGQSQVRGPRRNGLFQSARPQNVGGRFGPPAEAVSACAGQSAGANCGFTAPQRGDQISGICGVTPGGKTACLPNGGPPRL